MKASHPDDDRDGIRIAGALSSFGNADREGDLVKQDAFDDTVKEFEELGKIPLLRDHRAETEFQIGSIDKLKITLKKLKFEAFISRDERSQHVIKLIEDGHLNTVSMGGLFKFSSDRDKNGNFVIEKVMLFEGSVVPIPANKEAVFEMKSFEPEAENPDLVEEPEGESKETEVLSRTERMRHAINVIREGKKCQQQQ